MEPLLINFWAFIGFTALFSGLFIGYLFHCLKQAERYERAAFDE